MKNKSKTIFSSLVSVSLITIIGFGVVSQAFGEGQHKHGVHGHHNKHQHKHRQKHGHPMNGEHDEVNMPGLNGLNINESETEEMKKLFRGFTGIERSVDNLPNGIHSITKAKTPELHQVLVSHVIGMISRVEQKNDPKVFIQSPTLDIFFLRSEAIKTKIDVTEKGIEVIQTSDDPEVVKALHAHAAEVSDMVERGMESVHERMHGSH